ncbi:ABC transporter ATP-binding protein [Microbulbifer spongiae]|uniref:ABC transporter ATP-binding protein n=1 Tax=Microbulbifer spongiae TaxID=2944933 RepID=A0ABY9EEC4_9GAMM|nr:ABC transporter ATP-binding protein [Microbulbifer sp. MI-G]WKD50612.1 ABC transporter ATP-binding protein [Microbulbifer sp. MI-G]
MQPILSANDLECRYGNRVVIESVSLSLLPGEIACLLGPSGCGKTTLLQAIAGFQPLASGSITLEGKTISSAGAMTPPEKRNIGMVFQDYALFPHLNLADNVAFGIQSLGGQERRARVAELLQLVQLQEYAKQFPHQLSGGQQQRVALARALAPRPRLLLMDEPFSNLDSALRRSLAAEVRQILRAQGTPAMIVTHDRSEAFIAGDTLGVLSGGQLQQWDTPQQLYRHPANIAVARIVSDGTLFEGRVIHTGLAETPLGKLELPHQGFTAGEQIRVFVRSEDILPGDHPHAVLAHIIEKTFLGDRAVYKFRLPGGNSFSTSLKAAHHFPADSTVPLRLSRPLVFTTHSEDRSPYQKVQAD